MITTTLTFPVHITYESDCPLDDGDLDAVRYRLETRLHSDLINDRLDPTDRQITAYALEVSSPDNPGPHVPETDEDALHYLLNGLSERGWSFLTYDDGGGHEPVESIEDLISAVLAVSDTVTVYLRHEELRGAYIVLLAQDSPEDVLVDHTWMEPLNSDVAALWRIFE